MVGDLERADRVRRGSPSAAHPSHELAQLALPFEGRASCAPCLFEPGHELLVGRERRGGGARRERDGCDERRGHDERP